MNYSKAIDSLALDVRSMVERARAEDASLAAARTPLQATMDALTAEQSRRARSGVRIRVTADDFDTRHVAVLDASLRHNALALASSRQRTQEQSALIASALALIGQMADALAAPERLAAEQARLEAAETAKREAAEAYARLDPYERRCFDMGLSPK